MKTFFLLLLLMALPLSAADPEPMRKDASKLEKQGNWREAYELRVKILRETSDEHSGTDLQKALESRRRGELRRADGRVDGKT